MYQNVYSQGIQSKVDENLRKYIAHLNNEMVDSFQGSGRHTSASKCPCGMSPCECGMSPCACGMSPCGCGMSGGSGYATATVRDLGFEPTIGAGGGKGSKTYRKIGSGQIAALPPPENVKELGNVGAGMPMGTMKRVVGGKKMGKGTKELKEDVGKFDFNRIKDYLGLAKPKMGKGRVVAQKVVENSVMPPVIGAAKQIKKADKPVPMELLPINVGNIDQALNAERKRYIKKKEAAELPDPQDRYQKVKDKGAGMSGGMDGRKRRAEIVKKYMKEHGVKMIAASKKVKELGLYKK